MATSSTKYFILGKASTYEGGIKLLYHNLSARARRKSTSFSFRGENPRALAFMGRKSKSFSFRGENPRALAFEEKIHEL